MQRHGWTLLFHECVTGQLQRLHAAVQRAQAKDLQGFEHHANVKLSRALSQLMMEAIPSDPARAEYRQGNTLGGAYRHWRRAKIGRRFHLFFRYDERAKIIVYAWVNDEQTLCSSGSQSDPYTVFEKMHGRDNPPDDWKLRVQASKQDWNEQA